MTLDLKGKRIVVTGGKHPVERAIAEAVAQEGADVVFGYVNGMMTGMKRKCFQ